MSNEKRTRVRDVIAWLANQNPDHIVFTDDVLGLGVLVDRYDYSGGSTEWLPVNNDGITDGDK